MEIKQEQIQAIVDDLIMKKDRLEDKPSNIESVPSKYLGVAIYAHVIDQLRGLLPDETE